MSAKRKQWTPAEIKRLTALYPDTKTATIAAELGCSVGRIYWKADDLGLKKSAAYLAGPDACRLRRGDNVGAAYRLKPGNTPWNKGHKFDAGGRSGETRFKPGIVPHTWKPIGTERISKDGNRSNRDIGNLEMLTRAQLMARNTIHNYPKEIAELVQLRGAITRQINGEVSSGVTNPDKSA